MGLAKVCSSFTWPDCDLASFFFVTSLVSKIGSGELPDRVVNFN